VVLAAAARAAAADRDAGEADTVPIHVDLTEQAEVRRLLIDVEVLDEEGRPMPGLGREDFRVRLDYLWRRLLSVDDLCACTADGAAEPPADPLLASVVRRETTPRFVLYLDLSQLDPTGLREATERAAWWVRHSLPAGAQAMVAAHLRGAGVQELSPFVSETGPLLAALDRLARGAEGSDPFPAAYGARLDMCWSGTVSCYYTGRKEYWQSRASLLALIGFLTRMEQEPGRKVLLLFHRNLTMLPGRMYAAPPGRPLDDADLVPDLIDLVDEVGAAATSGRTEIHPLVVGGGATWTVNLGANVADRSGGDYNRGAHDLDRVLDAVSRGCPCIYRLGLEPPGERSHVYRVKVVVRGRALPHRQRVQSLTGEDRWAHRVAAVLTNPEDSWPLPLRASLVPGPRDRRGFGLTARVGLDLTDLAVGEGAREWEVGALLAEQRETRTGRVWELAGYARLAAEAPALPSLVLHEHVLEGLRPGRYELRAWAYDRTAGIYGGARTEIELPSAMQVPASTEGDHRKAALPLRDRPDVLEVVPLTSAP
jgi:hypothetical protein